MVIELLLARCWNSQIMETSPIYFCPSSPIPRRPPRPTPPPHTETPTTASHQG
jgi:hypothetical protein